MRTPHGGELSVLTPAGRSLVIVPYLRKGREPEGHRFRYIRRLTLRTDTLAAFATPESRPEPVFTDSGVYALQLNSDTDPETSPVCRARYHSPG